MKPGIIQKIFKDHFEAYRKTRVLGRRQYHAAGNIMTCRTAEQGYHINACPNGDYEVLVHNSCKHRSCPLCGSTETQLWLERRKPLGYGPKRPPCLHPGSGIQVQGQISGLP